MLPTDVKCSSNWGSWVEWSDYYPSCIETAGLFSDSEKHAPKRYRDRNCEIKNSDGSVTVIDIADQECCPVDQKSQTQEQPIAEQSICTDTFTELTGADPTLIETKVIAEFTVAVLEIWDDRYVHYYRY